MEIHVDLEVIPPTIVLHGAEDFKTFKIVIGPASHTRVPVAVLERLAGSRADDPEWCDGLAKMLDYARQHGFLTDHGIRAHVEWSPQV